MKFYYPQNLESKPLIIVWSRGNAFFIMFAVLGAVLLFAVFRAILPLLAVACHSFLTATVDDISIYGYIHRMWRFVITQQTKFYWRQPMEMINK